jgi:hypothetical protein
VAIENYIAARMSLLLKCILDKFFIKIYFGGGREICRHIYSCCITKRHRLL